ncbi:MAG: TonB-dependent receptor [Dyella sp.]
MSLDSKNNKNAATSCAARAYQDVVKEASLLLAQMRRRHTLMSRGITPHTPMIAATVLLGLTATWVSAPAQAQSVSDQPGPSTPAAVIPPKTTQTLEEVTVTSQKRSSTVQNTPVSLTAVTGDALQDRGITHFSTLAQSTPGVSLKSEGPGQTEIELRGMTSSGGNSPTVGFYLDDIPLTAPASAQNGKVVIDPTLYDLDHVEILRGPQGTLYGAGSMGGTVRLLSNPPDATGFSGSVESTVSGTDGGGFNHDGNVMLNIPLVQDKLALRLVATEAHTSGWIDRIVANEYPVVTNNGASRGNVADAPVQKQYPDSNTQQLNTYHASLLWQPTTNLTITPSVFVEHSKQDGVSAYDSTPATNAHYQPFDIAEPLSDSISIFSVNTKYSLENLDITSITAYWSRRSQQTEDASEDFNNPQTGVTYAANYGLPNPGYYGADGSGPAQGHESDPSRQLSQELRFSTKGDGPLQAVGGVFFSNFSSTWNFAGVTANPNAYMDVGSGQRATTTNWFDVYSPTQMKQYAVFGDLTYALTDKLKLDVGARAYRYDYNYSSTISGWGSALGVATPSATGLITQQGNSFDPKLNLSYQFTPQVLGYFTVSKGSRPGGGNAKYPTTGAYWSAVFNAYKFSGNQWPSTYKPDYVWSYELGEKGRFLDNHLVINADVYYENWRNIQLEALPGDWALNINGNYAHLYGTEVEAKALLGHGFELDLSGSYTHAYVDPGEHWQITPLHVLSDVAPVVGNVVASYTTNLNAVYSLKFQAESAYVGKRYSLAFPYGYSLNGEYIQLPSYMLTNLRATLSSSDGWSAALFADNVFNRRAELESLFQENLPSAAFNRIVTNQPRTVGIDLTYNF